MMADDWVSPPGSAPIPEVNDWVSPSQTHQANDWIDPSEINAGRAVQYGVVNAIPFGKDIAAGVETAESYLPKALRAPGDVPIEQTGSLSERFQQNRERLNATDRALGEAYPVTSAVVPLATAAAALPVAGPIDAVASGVGRVAPYLGSFAANTVGSGAVGAGYGALYGAGSGDSTSDRIHRAETGALYGGIGGALAPAVASGIGGLASAVAAPLGGVFSPAATAGRKIAQATAKDLDIGNTALSPSDFAAAKASGQPAMVADLGGETTRALARKAANESPEARSILADPINERFASQGTRFSDFLSNIYGNDLNSQAARDAIRSQAKTINTPAYQQAYSDGANGVWNQTLERLINAPDVQTAIADANRKGANSAVLNNQTIVKSPFVKNADGMLTLGKDANGNVPYPTLQYWDQVKRALDDKISVAQRAGNREDARDFMGLKNALLGELDAAVPTYANARQGAFKMFNAENALEAGENFLSLSRTADVDAAKAALAKMTPAEQSMFSRGLASQIAQKAENASERRNIIGLFNSPATAEKMQLGLGPQVASQVEAYLRRESAMDMLRTAVTGNSTTARQQHEGLIGDIKSAVANPVSGAMVMGVEGAREHGFDPVEIAKYAATGAMAGILMRTSKFGNENVMRNIAEQLASDNPAIANAALKRVAANPKLMDALRNAEGAISYMAGARLPQATPESAPVP